MTHHYRRHCSRVSVRGRENLYCRLFSGTIIVGLRASPNRIVIVNRKSKSIRYGECFGRDQTESKREKRNAAEKHGRAATYGPFKTMYTCRQSSARQHRSTRAAGIQDDMSTPGGGSVSNVDAPESNFKLY